MAEIRYVVLSDLHFGAQNSMLTTVEEHAGAATLARAFRTEATRPSALVGPILDGLRSLVAGQDQPPSLVLAGDVLDLALSSDSVACTAFECFVDEAFGPGRRLFAPSVYYLPGNHDHHLWEGARENQYLQYLRDLAPAARIEEPWHTTSLLTERQRPSPGDLLSVLMSRRPGCADITMRVAYPNMAIVSRDGGRCRVISHGHYTEPIYMLMSALKELLFPEQAPGPEGYTVARMEAENFAWIDFFWSTLGRSGDVGTDVGLVYADLSSSSDLDSLVRNLTKSLVSRNHGPHWLRPFEAKLTGAIASREAKHLARSERGTSDLTLSPKSSLGAKKYLEGPVRRQVLDEFGVIGKDLSFIFGHTHKPFVDRWELDGYPDPVTVYNTGGWVVDTAEPAVTQGGVAVLIDEDLNVASLQFYRQTADGPSAPAQVLDGPVANPLHDELGGRIDASRDPWRAVSDAASQMIAERHRLQAAVMKR